MNASNIQTQDTVSIQNIDRGKIRQSDNRQAINAGAVRNAAFSVTG